MLIGETSTFEKTTDRTYHTGDGSKTQFGIQFSGDNVQVFKEGLLQRNGTDITIDPGGMHVTFGTAPASGDIIDCLGFLEITNTGRNSVKRIEHLASAGQTQFTVPDFEVLDTLFVTLNGVVLYSTDFTQDVSNVRIVLASAAVQDDVVTIMHFKPTFRIGSSGSAAAAASAVAAATSETNAAASFDSFDDRYLGAKSTDPSLDNDGDALLDGTLYFNTTGNNMRVYDLGGAVWYVLAAVQQFPATTKMLFQQTAAPTGWTKDTTHTDKALRLTSGTVGTGGTVLFETAFAAVTPAITITNAAHTLITSEMPSHNHSQNSGWQTAYDNAPYNTYRFHQTGGQNAQRSATTVSSTGGGLGHTHTNTATATLDIDVSFVDVIIATKD